MIKYRDIRGMEVFSVAEGKAWGRITEVVVNTKKLVIEGFRVKEKDVRFLAASDVTTFGESSIVCDTGALLKNTEVLSKKKNISDGSSLEGLKVITKKGADAGRVDSFYFREEDGKITHFEISSGSFSGKGLLASEGVVFLGPDAMIANDSAVKVAMEMQSKSSIKTMFGKISKTTKDISKDVVSRLRSVKESSEKQMITLSKETRKKAEEAAVNVKTGTGKLRKKTKKIAKLAEKKFGTAGKKSKKTGKKRGPGGKEAK